MGRIVVYSTTGCPFCNQAKSLLISKDVKFEEVNLTDFPEYHEEMELLTGGQRTVPQIFFNDKYIGGSDQLFALETTDVLDDMIRVALDAPNTLLPRVPSTSTRELKPIEPLIPIDEEIDEIYNKLRNPKNGIKIRDHGVFLFSTKKAFKGSELIMWLMSQLKLTEQESIEVGQKLKDQRYFYRIKDYDRPFQNTTELYRFQEDVDPTILNMKRVLNKSESLSAAVVADALRRQMLLISDKYIYRQGKGVDYDAIAKSREFSTYLTYSLFMQNVDLGAMSQAELKSFFINVYNSLVIHALIVVGPPSNAINRNSFFNNVFYVIGGFKFSLSDIEHGILRGNKPPPIEKSVKSRFTKNDPRLQFMIQPDPRIHFALVCGAKSCPAVRVYSPENVEEALLWACEGFCAEETYIDVENKKVTISQLFNWYRRDFGENYEETLKWIANYLPEKKKKNSR